MAEITNLESEVEAYKVRGSVRDHVRGLSFFHMLLVSQTAAQSDALEKTALKERIAQLEIELRIFSVRHSIS